MVEDAINLAVEYAADPKYRKKLSFTGHSLGGGLASMAAIQTGLDAVTFNAMAISPKQYMRRRIEDRSGTRTSLTATSSLTIFRARR